MTYEEFKQNFLPEFLKIKSFAGKIKFASQYLTRIGSGSGRIVYDIDGQKVLKLARNPKGVAQNEMESNIGTYYDTRHIVTEIFEVADDETWIVSEKAKKVNEKRIKELTGIPSLNDLFYYLRNFESENKGGRRIFGINPDIKEQLSENEFTNDLLDLMNNYNVIAGDLGRPSSYGEVLRDGQPTIVVTDYGLSDEIYSTHYSPQRKQNYRMYELYNFADGNDDMLSDIGNVGQDQRRGMWALIPEGFGDGDEPMSDEFISYVQERDSYPDAPISNLPFLSDKFQECVNNIKETLNRVQDKKKFYGNLLKLQEYLVSQGVYDRDKLDEEEYSLNEELEAPNVQPYSLTDEAYATELSKAVGEKLGFKILKSFHGGSNGYAFDIGNNKVFKITADIGEADAASKLLRVQPRRIAKVYGLYKIVDTEKNVSYFGMIEQNIQNKPVDKFIRYNNIINTIMPNEMSFVDFMIAMKKKDANFDQLTQLAQGILNQNPEANISEGERNEAYNYLIGLFEIKKELLAYGIKSNDYSNEKNLGYENGVLTYFDFGGYRSEEPNVGDTNMIYLPENDDILSEDYDKNIADNIAMQIANKMGFGQPKYIDSGKHGAAYDIGNDKVLKITSDKSEATENKNLIGKPLKYIALPYNVFQISSKNSEIPETYAIVLEKLQTTPETQRMFDRLEYVFNDIFGIGIADVIEHYIGDWHNPNINIDNINSYLKKNLRDAEFFDGLLRIAEETRQYGVQSIDFLNAKNLGYKKNGILAFFDIGFSNQVQEPHAEKIEVDEDGTSKFSTINSVGQDDFPPYVQNDTSPIADNNVPTSIDELVERVMSSMRGSSTVDVKKKCRLAGQGNTSTACNQGDISNLDIKPIKESLTPLGDIHKNISLDELKRYVDNIENISKNVGDKKYLSDEDIDDLLYYYRIFNSSTNTSNLFKLVGSEKYYELFGFLKNVLSKRNKIKSLKEDIDASELYNQLSDGKSLQTLFDGRRDIALISLMNPVVEKKVIDNGFNVIPIQQTHHSPEIKTSIVYRDGYEKQANRLHDIMKSHGGYANDQSPEEAYEIGRLLQYSDNSIKSYVDRLYVKQPNGTYRRRTYDELVQYDKENEVPTTDNEFATYLAMDEQNLNENIVVNAPIKYDHMGWISPDNKYIDAINDSHLLALLSIYPEMRDKTDSIDGRYEIYDRAFTDGYTRIIFNKGIIGDILDIHAPNEERLKEIIRDVYPNIMRGESQLYTDIGTSKNRIPSPNFTMPKDKEDLYNYLYSNKKFRQNEGVGDTYAEKTFHIPSDYQEFDDRFRREQSIADKDQIVYKDEDGWTIIKNPRTLKNIAPYVRAVIDNEGNLYTEQRPRHIHVVIIQTLEELGLIKNQWDWDESLPKYFVTLQRYSNTNKYVLGESNIMMRPDDDRDNDKFWNKYPSRKYAEPVFQEFLNKAKAKNPNIDFVDVVISDYENINENIGEMNEAQLMSLQDLPFKQEVQELGGKIYSVNENILEAKKLYKFGFNL